MSHAFPYRRPNTDVVRPWPWARMVDDGATELAPDLVGWDYNTVMSLRRAVAIDGARARSGCGLGPDAELALSVRWSASTSMLRGRAWQRTVPDTNGLELDVSFDLPGTELGGSLDLEMILTVQDAGGSSSRAAPRRPGSIIWSDHTSINLEGDGVRFPLAVGNFADLLYPADTAWHLEIGSDLDAAALGTILLIVNEDRTAVVNALTSASTPSPEQAVILSFLSADIVRNLVEHAVTDEDFATTDEHPAGSLGAVLAAVLRTRLPDMDLESLRREHTGNPALFASRMQAAARLLAPPR